MTMDENSSDISFVERVHRLPWLHELDLGGGVVTPGRTKLDWLRTMSDLYFNMPLTGKSVLDVGCYDGFHSFDARQRGAKRVLATDKFMWQHDPRCREAFLLARSRICPDLEYREIDVLELTPDALGRFDIVLFAGVLYHAKNPFLYLELVSAMATETLIVKTYLDAMDQPRPAAMFYPSTELNNDPTNWWGPNPACVEGMLLNCGFARVDYTPHPLLPQRGVFHAHRG